MTFSVLIVLSFRRGFRRGYSPSFQGGAGGRLYMLFLKTPISFTSLIPSPILPTDEREKTDRKTAQLSVTKKCCLLRFALSRTCLAFASPLANILRSQPVTPEYLELTPSPSSLVARRCPVSHLPIPSHLNYRRSRSTARRAIYHLQAQPIYLFRL